MRDSFLEELAIVCQYNSAQRNGGHKTITRMLRRMMRFITPMAVTGLPKVRIGGPGDGGYVMLEPGCNGVACSLGVSDSSPWDLDMAMKGFNVYQYDGTIKDSPDKHPLIHFLPYNIGLKPWERNISEVLMEI